MQLGCIGKQVKQEVSNNANSTTFHTVNFRFREMLRYWLNATVDIIVTVYNNLFYF